MSNNTAMKSSSYGKIQSTTEIMMQVFDDLRENRPIRLKEDDLTSFPLHRRYKSLQSISAGNEATKSTTALMIKVFTDLRENRPIAVESIDSKNVQAQRRCKSMPNMAFETNSAAGDALEEAMTSIASTHMNVLTYAEPVNSEVMTPLTATTGVSDIELSVPLTLPSVQQIESDAQEFRSIIQNMVTKIISDAQLIQPPEHKTTLQDMGTQGECKDDLGTDTTVTAVRPRRRSLWSLVKRLARRIFCCGAIDKDHSE